jgi:high-affinity iron transporter
VITLREGLEAALIVGIILGYLTAVGAKALARPIYVGIAAAIVASVAVGAAFLTLSVEFEGEAEEIFEGATMFLAAAILTSMILWMHKNSKSYSDSIKRRVELAVTRNQTLGLATLAFVSIFREGIETVLFLGSSSFSSSGVSIMIGGLLGIGAAVMVGVAVIRYSLRIDLRRFFQITGIVLVLFAAGLVSRGIGELNEVGIIPPLAENLWDSGGFISDDGTLGGILSSLFGYTSSPTLAQVIGYVSYWSLVLAWFYRASILAILRKTAALPTTE